MAYKKQKNVNIDALIAREDFEAADETTNTASKISTLSVNDLKEGSGLFLASVRKPDFQRETADWDIDKIVRFIKSFVDGEFIPLVHTDYIRFCIVIPTREIFAQLLFMEQSSLFAL